MYPTNTYPWDVYEMEMEILAIEEENLDVEFATDAVECHNA